MNRLSSHARPGPSRRLLAGALLASAAVLLARLAAAPEISDPTGAALPAALHLRVPALYLALAPLFSLWDGISMLGMQRLRGFLAGLALGYVAWRVLVWVVRRRSGNDIRRAGFLRRLGRELLVLALSLAGFLAFALGAALWHRPMLALAGTPAGTLAVDFHSHTAVSRDVRGTLMRGYDAAANQRWHARAGFDVAFVTDHNTTAGLGEPLAGSTLLCPGIELSAWRAHVVLLGATPPIDRRPYTGDSTGLYALLRDSRARWNALAIVSLPEYERNHWSRLDALAEAGAAGFELVNAAPKASELTRARRDTVLAVARRHGRFVAGVSDSHGWGATSMAWSLVRAGDMGDRPEQRCHAVLQRLETGGADAVQIAERHHLHADAAWPLWLTPAGVVWETWRGMGWAQALSWLGWIWLPVLVSASRRRAADESPLAEQAGIENAAEAS